MVNHALLAIPVRQAEVGHLRLAMRPRTTTTSLKLVPFVDVSEAPHAMTQTYAGEIDRCSRDPCLPGRFGVDLLQIVSGQPAQPFVAIFKGAD